MGGVNSDLVETLANEEIRRTAADAIEVVT